MTSVRPQPEYDDTKTYPKFLGGRLVEISGKVLNCKDDSQPIIVTQKQWYDLCELVEKLKVRVQTLEDKLLG